MAAPKREKHPNWKGGRFINDYGYVMILKRSHPRANCKGYVREHILVMEEKLGRPLRDKEEIHHINGNKQDNRPENLMLMANRSEHIKVHSRCHAIDFWNYNKRTKRKFTIGVKHEKGLLITTA